MKKIFLVASVVILLSSFCYSQGNLQFNQVVIVSTSDLTVPVGKVWKIESYQQQQVWANNAPITNCTDLSRPRPYYIDGNQFYDVDGLGTGNAGYAVTAGNQFPIWLKAGQTARTSCSGDFLSVIEFNIIP